MMNSPMVAFQKPITDHGSVMANSTTRMKSITPKPPAESANDSSQTSPTIEASTISGEEDAAPRQRVGGRSDRVVGKGAVGHVGWGAFSGRSRI